MGIEWQAKKIERYRTYILILFWDLWDLLHLPFSSAQVSSPGVTGDCLPIGLTCAACSRVSILQNVHQL